MGAVQDAFNIAFRDFVTAGIPASGEYEPDKALIRAIGPIIEQLFAVTGLSDKPYETPEDGAAATTDGDLFWVKGSGTEAARLYKKVGGVAVDQGIAIPSTLALESFTQSMIDALALINQSLDAVSSRAIQGSSKPSTFSFLTQPLAGGAARAFDVGSDSDGFSPLWGDTEGAVHIKFAADDTIEAVGGSRRSFTHGYPMVIVDQDGWGFPLEYLPGKSFTYGAPVVHVDDDGYGFPVDFHQTKDYIAFPVSAGDHSDVAVMDAPSGRMLRLTYNDGDNFSPTLTNTGVRWVRQSGSSVSVREQTLSVQGATNVADGVATLWQAIGIGQSNIQGADSYGPGGATTDPDGVLASGRTMEFLFGVNPGGNGLTAPATEAVLGTLRDMQSDNGTTIFPRMLFGLLPAVGATGALVGTALGQSGAGYSGIKKGSIYYANALATIMAGRRLAFNDNMNHRVPFFANLHGEADRGAFLADYLGYLYEWQNDFQTDLRAILLDDNYVLPFLLSQMSGWTYYNDVARSEVPLAQLKCAIDNPAKFICVGPRYHLPYWDNGVHLTREGQRKHGEEFARAGRALMSSFDANGNPNGAYSPLRVASGSRSGTTVTLTTAGKVGNLVIDTALISDPGNFGITYRDTSGNQVAVSNVQIASASAGTITFTIASAVAGVAEIAMRGTPGAAPGAISGARACFRDSSTDISAVDGSPLYKHICHGEVAIS